MIFLRPLLNWLQNFSNPCLFHITGFSKSLLLLILDIDIPCFVFHLGSLIHMVHTYEMRIVFLSSTGFKYLKAHGVAYKPESKIIGVSLSTSRMELITFS